MRKAIVVLLIAAIMSTAGVIFIQESLSTFGNTINIAGTAAPETDRAYCETVCAQSLNRKAKVRKKTQTRTRNEFTIERMMEYINMKREFNGLTPLTFDPDLNDAASIRAQECCVLYSHTRPNGEMCFSVSPKVNGEILLEGPWDTTYERCIKSWIDSPDHKAVLLRDCTMTAGIGYAYYPERQAIYWCVLFDEQ